MDKRVDNKNNEEQKSLYGHCNTGKNTKSYTPSGAETSEGINPPHTTSNVSSIKEK